MNINEDNSTAEYLELAAVAKRCQVRLSEMEADDYLRSNVELLLEMTQEKMEKVAADLPF